MAGEILQSMPGPTSQSAGLSRTVLGQPRENGDVCHGGTCRLDCEWIFARLLIYPGIRRETRVEWVLHPQFSGPEPYTYQLQVGRTGLPHADDWTNLGDPVSGATYLIDLPQRVYGKFQWTHYRLLLTDAGGTTYASAPHNCLGRLTRSDWLQVRELKRLEQLRLKREAGTEGYLLKRRLFGAYCDCTDPLTQEVRDAQCPTCFGTGFVGGYFDAYPCFYVELAEGNQRGHLDPMRGSVDDLPVVKGRMVNDPQVFSYDIFVQKNSDIRWLVHELESKVEMRGLPVIVEATLRQLPFSNVAYDVPIPELA